MPFLLTIKCREGYNKAKVSDTLKPKTQLNETKKNVTISENNFKTNLNGKWEFPIAPNKLSNSQKQFLFEKADAPFMGYYEAMGDEPFGAAGTDLEAAVCFMTQSTESKMDLVVTYDAKVYKVALDI